jgi:hypothetical protein
MRNLKSVAALCLMLLLGPLAATAQMGATAAGPADPAKSYDSLLRSFEEQFTGVAKLMPADKYDFAPSAAIFKPEQTVKFDTVRSFGAEIKHVIQANYFFYGAVGGMKPDVDMKSIGALKTKDEILAALAKSFAFAHKAVATLTTQNILDTIPPVDGITMRGTLAGFGVAHGFDHYGQMVEYLRMNGLVPPGSK